MASQKPTQPPAGDFATFAKALFDQVRKLDGSAYTVFGDGTLPKFTRWVGGTGEYDGKGLRDVVKGNADFLDRVKGDVDAHSQAIIEMRQDIQELQEAPATHPFP